MLYEIFQHEAVLAQCWVAVFSVKRHGDTAAAAARSHAAAWQRHPAVHLVSAYLSVLDAAAGDRQRDQGNGG